MTISEQAVQAAKLKYVDLAFKYNWHDSTPDNDAMREILTSALPHLQLGYEVKKLEWELICGDGSKRAKTPFGEYKTDKHHMQLWFPESKDEYPHFSSDPFQEAQADFERRVRECVVDAGSQGWLYFNEDTGTEYSADHPVISGECPDAQDIKPAPNENLLHELLSSWKAWAEDRQEIADLRAEIAVKPVDVAAVRRHALLAELDSGIEQLLDIQQDINFEANSRMSQSLCDASAYIDKHEAFLRRIRFLFAEPAQGEQWQPTHRHVKRGTEYQLTGTGKMQAEKWYEYPCERPVNSIDMQEVAIYRGDDGQLWVRPVAEFNDGRFEILPTTPTSEEDA